MMKGFSLRITKWIRSHDTGAMYAIRMFRIHMRDWIFWRCSKRTNLVFATAYDGYRYGDNPKYIIEKIHELSPTTEIVWMCADEIKGNIPNYVQTVAVEEQAKVIRHASVIIGNSSCFYYQTNRKDQLRIETWHGGLGFKKMGVEINLTGIPFSTRKKPGYDFYISNSDHLTKVYRTAFHYYGAVWKCGYPIEDALLTDGKEKQRCHDQYCIPKNTRIILYMPTFREKYGWRSKLKVEYVVKAFEKRFGKSWTLIVHWHQSTRIEDRILSGAIDVTDNQNIQELIKASDAFISDYSSSIFQAVQRHIPCFVYADDYEEYSIDRGLYYPLDEQPFPYALTEEALIDNILHYDASVWDEKWKQYQVRVGHVVTGHSAEDVAKVCVDFLNGKPKADIMKEIPFETRF